MKTLCPPVVIGVHPFLSVLALAIAALVWSSVPAAAVVQCSAVAYDAQVPPDTTQPLSKRFDNQVAVNAGGDTLFVAQPAGLADRLYLYPAGSAALGLAVATGLGPAPNGQTYRKDGVFRNVSVNDGGDLAFSAFLLNDGQALFVRRAGVFRTAADNTAAGGSVSSLGAVSLINASGQVAFVGTTDKKRVIRYDPASDTRTSLIEAGQLTDRNREVCNFVAVGLGDSGDVVVHGPTKASCADANEHAVDALFYTSAGSLIEIAEVEDPTPLGSTWYSFGDGVYMNASGHMTFRAGVLNTGSGVFLHDPGAATPTRALVFTTDHTPEGPAFGIPQIYRLSNADEIVFESNITTQSIREGFYTADGGFTTILTRPGRTGHPEDKPPVPPFASSARYTDFLALDADVGATRVAFRAAVLDAGAKARQAVVSCTF